MKNTLKKVADFIKTASDYWQIGVILFAFLGSMTGSYMAWRTDYNHLKFVQDAQAETLSQHSTSIHNNEMVLATIPPMKETIDRIDSRVGRIEDYLITKKGK